MMSMLKGKYPSRRGLALGVAATLALTGLVACTKHQASVVTTTVSPNGGTYQLGDKLTVTAPAGAVAADTTLSATQVEELTNGEPAPLQDARKGLVHFDLSLADGKQPLKPLELTAHLQGNLLPDGTTPSQAMLYTASPDGNGYQLIPATLDASNTLHAQLTHLSPKFLAFLDPATLVVSLAQLQKPAPNVPNCAQDATTPATGKVTLSGDGWTTKTDSPVHPCLKVDGSQLKLEIANNIHYVWSVKASHGVTVVSPSDDVNDEMVKAVTNFLYPELRPAAHLSRSSLATATIPAASLPALVQLQANPSTYLGEITWFALNFLAEITLGVNEAGAAKAVVELFSRATKPLELLSCLQGALKVTNGTANFDDVYGKVIVTCGSLVAESLESLSTDPNLWGKFWARIFAVAHAPLDALNFIEGAYTGAVQGIKGLVSIRISPADDGFSAFVGSWDAHGSSLEIKADHTGTGIFNAGPCADPFQNPNTPTCAGYETDTFTIHNGIVTGTYQSIVYKDSFSGRVVTDASYLETSAKPGQTFQYKLISPGFIETNYGSGGTGHLCGAGASPQNLHDCGF
jgi:hypothetical protein